MNCLRFHDYTKTMAVCEFKTTLVMGISLWMLSFTFAADVLLPRPTTGGPEKHKFSGKYKHFNGSPKQIKMKINHKDLAEATLFATDMIRHLDRLETNLGWSDISVKQGTPSYGLLIESAPETRAFEQGKKANIVSKASLQLINKHCLNHKTEPIDCAKHISKYKLTNTPLRDFCSENFKWCSPDEFSSRYRKQDGSCNRKTSQGRSLTSYKRLLHPDYLDGIQEIRRSVHKKYGLPSPRAISNEFVKIPNAIDANHTLALMQWGDFISHDLAQTVSNKMIYSEKSIECCEPNGFDLSPRYIHPFCASIPIPLDDAFYNNLNVRCMSYVRSLPAIRPDCSFGPNEQLNQATHFLDASQIYGSDERKTESLRSMTRGQLKSSDHKGGGKYLPISIDPIQACDLQYNSTCYVAGDPRVNINPDLTTMHILWLREHNRLTHLLRKENPHWDDEQSYQEARRIVVAEVQHITYNEWLPEILGPSNMDSILSGHKEETDPSVSNSFATAAIQFVKSMMVDRIGLYSEKRERLSELSLRKHFNKPMVTNLDALVRGLATQQSNAVDLEYVTDLTNHLYDDGILGTDAFSIDIQRGRDHGLPSYTAFRSLCGLPDLSSFHDFRRVMPAKVAKSLENVYKHPNDVDLLVGGLAENPHGDSMLGPTLHCIVSDQFMRTRSGDRYFYSHPKQPGSFTEDQLGEIRKVTLARIFCDNADHIATMQPNVMKTLSSSNALVACNSTSDIPRLDLKHWKD